MSDVHIYQTVTALCINLSVCFICFKTGVLENKLKGFTLRNMIQQSYFLSFPHGFPDWWLFACHRCFQSHPVINHISLFTLYQHGIHSSKYCFILSEIVFFCSLHNQKHILFFQKKKQKHLSWLKLLFWRCHSAWMALNAGFTGPSGFSLFLLLIVCCYCRGFFWRNTLLLSLCRSDMNKCMKEG